MSRKPRADSVLDSLPENQRAALEQWLFDDSPRLTYAQARERLWLDCSVRCSERSLSAFYQRAAQRRMLDRIAASADRANAVVKRFEENPADTYKAVVNMVGQLAFEQSFKEEKEVSVEALFDLTRLLIASRKEDIREQALGLEREKFQRETCALFLKWAADQRAREIASAPATNAEKIEQLGQLMFGTDWKK